MIFNLQSFGLGFISGLATGVLARELGSVSGSALKPIAKALIKTGVIAMQKARESLAHMGEAIEDIMAEVNAETGVHTEAAAGVPAEKKTVGSRKSAAAAGVGQ
jgi:hypothetical protein